MVLNQASFVLWGTSGIVWSHFLVVTSVGEVLLVSNGQRLGMLLYGL